MSPEAGLGPGFVDYKIDVGNGKFIHLELKPLFDHSNSNKPRQERSLRLRPLNLDEHQDQILKYIKKGSEFVILTNLREWHFFNDSINLQNFYSFHDVQ